MTDEKNQNDETPPEVDMSSLTPEQITGHENNDILPSGEKIVFEYSPNGEYSGFHKEPANG